MGSSACGESEAAYGGTSTVKQLRTCQNVDYVQRYHFHVSLPAGHAIGADESLGSPNQSIRHWLSSETVSGLNGTRKDGDSWG